MIFCWQNIRSSRIALQCHFLHQVNASIQERIQHDDFKSLVTKLEEAHQARDVAADNSLLAGDKVSAGEALIMAKANLAERLGKEWWSALNTVLQSHVICGPHMPPEKKRGRALLEDLYDSVNAGIPQEFIQVAATLYEIFYCSTDDDEDGAQPVGDDVQGEEREEDEGDETTLGERMTQFPSYRPLLSAFPTKEDAC